MATPNKLTAVEAERMIGNAVHLLDAPVLYALIENDTGSWRWSFALYHEPTLPHPLNDDEMPKPFSLPERIGIYDLTTLDMDELCTIIELALED